MLIWSLTDTRPMDKLEVAPSSSEQLLPLFAEKLTEEGTKKFQQKYLKIDKKDFREPLSRAKELIDTLISYTEEDTLDWLIAFLNDCDLLMLSQWNNEFYNVTNYVMGRNGEPIKSPIIFAKFHKALKNMFPTPVQGYSREDKKAAAEYADRHIPEVSMSYESEREFPTDLDSLIENMRISHNKLDQLRLNTQKRKEKIEEYLSTCTPTLALPTYHRVYAPRGDEDDEKDAPLLTYTIKVDEWDMNGAFTNVNKEFIDGIITEFERFNLPAYAVERAKKGGIKVVSTINLRNYVHHDFSDLALEKL